MTQGRSGHTATLLPDGRVYIVGGHIGETGTAVAATEIWDPATETFSVSAPLAEARSGHTATLLPDGRVLIIGGGNTEAVALASTELWDPRTESFSPGQPLTGPRAGHTATLLFDGSVLIAGGEIAIRNHFVCPGRCLASAEVWRPGDERFVPTGSLGDERVGHTATLLPDGRVLVVAGGLMDGVVRSAELYETDGRAR